MRIGIEAQRIFRKKRHGMDMVAVELIRHLQEIDQTNDYFIFVNQVEDNSCIQETANFRIIQLKESPYPIWEQWHLPRAAKKYQLDVLHCTSNTAPIWGKTPLVLTLHDIIYLEKISLKSGTWYQRLGNLYRRWNVPRVVPRASFVFTVSAFEQKRIQEHFSQIPYDKIRVVHNGVSPHFQPVSEEIQEVKRLEYGLPDRFMLFLGNTDPKKNLIGVLKALLLLEKSGKLPLPLVMPDFGESELTALLDKIGGATLRPKIHLTGYIPNQDLPAIYAKALFFLYPSLRESFGLPILEAMACGCAVITSNTSSMPEIAGDSALLVDPFNPEELAQAMASLLDNETLRKELAEKGFQRPPLFSYAVGAKKVWGMYEQATRMRP
ncbi:MAG: glycosyltransferase family 4 protein [Lunatimonas sp.]|uniref:glycosyltransferase family 4 protein n=1 Tax=Lunatimonas sp. TaxID=2060141 RepID=UPI00263BD15C|nr:glycosyltransferase family 1 protein [Lunatimonas sp.]MCC5935923.1 glycosyltransferase family 4 protein [Lunatimonas sp.]